MKCRKRRGGEGQDDSHINDNTPPPAPATHTHAEDEGHIIWMQPTSSPHPGEPPIWNSLTAGGSDWMQFVEGDGKSLIVYSDFELHMWKKSILRRRRDMLQMIFPSATLRKLLKFQLHLNRTAVQLSLALSQCCMLSCTVSVVCAHCSINTYA